MIQAGFNPLQVVHIPTFVTTDDSMNEIEANHRSALYVGRISPEKGVDFLIEAFSLIQNKSVELTIAGDVNTEYARNLVNYVPSNVSQRIHFVGFKSPKQVAQLFRSNLFFIVPSVWYENLPNVLLEGMAAGRAGLVSNLGSLAEVVQDGINGHHFEIANTLDLAQRMDFMFDHPEKTIKIGAQARHWVQEKYSLESHLRSLNSLLTSVTKKK
jgi:glycosyltransferase involved in cell wall biosynthesis